MSSLKETKRRIGSVKNTQKITKAMKLVSASKYARACQKREQALQYRRALGRMLVLALHEGGVAEGVEAYRKSGTLSEGPVSSARTLVVVMAADRGLCGALNAGVLKKAQAVLGEPVIRDGGTAKESPQWDVMLWGKKSHSLLSLCGGQEFADRLFEVDRQEWRWIHEHPEYVTEQAQAMIEGFMTGRWCRVRFVYPEFHNVLVQKPIDRQWLPLLPHSGGSTDTHTGTGPASDAAVAGNYAEEDFAQKVCFEPDPVQMAEMLTRKLLINQLQHALLESEICEHAARMSAMDHATQNASEVIKTLTLEYNRERQAAITTELVEITSGAEAL